jgi:hypothetical protein
LSRVTKAPRFYFQICQIEERTLDRVIGLMLKKQSLHVELMSSLLPLGLEVIRPSVNASDPHQQPMLAGGAVRQQRPAGTEQLPPLDRVCYVNRWVSAVDVGVQQVSNGVNARVPKSTNCLLFFDNAQYRITSSRFLEASKNIYGLKQMF